MILQQGLHKGGVQGGSLWLQPPKAIACFQKTKYQGCLLMDLGRVEIAVSLFLSPYPRLWSGLTALCGVWDSTSRGENSNCLMSGTSNKCLMSDTLATKFSLQPGWLGVRLVFWVGTGFPMQIPKEVVTEFNQQYSPFFFPQGGLLFEILTRIPLIKTKDLLGLGGLKIQQEKPGLK